MIIFSVLLVIDQPKHGYAKKANMIQEESHWEEVSLPEHYVPITSYGDSWTSIVKLY